MESVLESGQVAGTGCPRPVHRTFLNSPCRTCGHQLIGLRTEGKERISLPVMKLKAFFPMMVGLLFAHAVSAANSESDAKQFWPQWRGPLATGVAPLADPPLTWSETNNLKWKVKIPGAGDSTPIVWSGRVFILSAIPTGKKIVAKPAPTPDPSAADKGLLAGELWANLCL